VRLAVGTQWHQIVFDLVAFADILKPWEINAIAAVKDGATIYFDNETAKTAMQIGQKAGAPVMTRRLRNFQCPERHRLPVIELMHDIEAEIVNERANANRHDDRLIGSDPPQRSSVEVIKMRMCHQHQIDIRQMM